VFGPIWWCTPIWHDLAEIHDLGLPSGIQGNRPNLAYIWPNWAQMAIYRPKLGLKHGIPCWDRISRFWVILAKSGCTPIWVILADLADLALSRDIGVLGLIWPIIGHIWPYLLKYGPKWAQNPVFLDRHRIPRIWSQNPILGCIPK
jgi:hypothetical protein